MRCPECGAQIADGMMLCAGCGAEIRLIPDFDPTIEGEISDTLSELDLQTAADTRELPDLSEVEFLDADGYAYADAEDGDAAYDDAFYEDAPYEDTSYEDASYDEAAYEDEPYDEGGEEDGAYEEEFDEEYDGDFLDELDDFEDEEDVVKQIALAIRESRFRWLYAGLFLVAVVMIGIAGYSVSRMIYQDNSAPHQAQLAANAAAVGDYTSAIEHMERALTLDSSDTNRKYTLVDYYFSDGQDDKALLLLWEIIYAQDATSASAYQRVLRYYEERQDYARIEEILATCSDPTILTQFTAYVANPPEFSLPEGTYDEVVTLNLSSNTNGTIYYTMDGSIPTTESEVFTAPLTLDLGLYTVKAIFVNTMGLQSEVASAQYTIYIRVPDAPEVYPASGDYERPVWISAFAQRYCTLHYTTDGTTPTMDSPQYTVPLPMPLGNSHFIFAAYSQEGVLGELRDVQYSLRLSAEIDTQSVIDALRQYNLNNGRTIDNYGHLPGGTTRYSYTVGHAITLPQPSQPEEAEGGALVSVTPPANTRIYYLVTENLIDSSQVSMRTGSYFMCDIESGELYKARRSESGYERGELIPAEAYAVPEIEPAAEELLPVGIEPALPEQP